MAALTPRQVLFNEDFGCSLIVPSSEGVAEALVLSESSAGDFFYFAFIKVCFIHLTSPSFKTTHPAKNSCLILCAGTRPLVDWPRVF